MVKERVKGKDKWKHDGREKKISNERGDKSDNNMENKKPGSKSKQKGTGKGKGKRTIKYSVYYVTNSINGN